MKSIGYFFLLSIIASFLPFLAGIFFDSPSMHGFFCADMFFLSVMLALPRRKIVYKMPFVVIAVVYWLWQETIDSFALTVFYLFAIFVITALKRNNLPLFLTFSIGSLVIFLADCDVFFYTTFVLFISDIWDLASYFWWGMPLFLLIPLLQVSLLVYFARNVLWGKSRVEISHTKAMLMVIVVLVSNCGVNFLQLRQLPIFDFPVKDWLWHKLSSGIVTKNLWLDEKTASNFAVWKYNGFIENDFQRPTVSILVESWGVSKNNLLEKALLEPFDSSKAYFSGLLLRQSAHTQGAEWEDFGTNFGKIQDDPIPRKFQKNGLQTWYFHGYGGHFYNRMETYAKFGFDSLLFKKDLVQRGLKECQYGFYGICDSSVIEYLDSLLTDSVPKYIYWTTLDAHPPYELSTIEKTSPICESLHLASIECTYFTLQENTSRKIAWLASRHPNYEFIIRGDHRPMGSVAETDFVQSFYFRWVSMVVLNYSKRH